MSKIIVTGGSGLVGFYLKKILNDAIFLSSSDYDLTKEDEVKKMFTDLKSPNGLLFTAKQEVLEMLKFNLQAYI